MVQAYKYQTVFIYFFSSGIIRKAALYNKNGHEQKDFQAVEVWVYMSKYIYVETTTEEMDHLTIVKEANKIYSSTVTTVMIYLTEADLCEDNQFNATMLQGLKTLANSEKLRFGVYSEPFSHPCPFLEALPLQYIDLVYVAYHTKIEFEDCKTKMEQLLKMSNTKLGFTSLERKVLVFGTDVIETRNHKQHNEYWGDYFSIMSQLFQTPMMIDSRTIVVQNETEYGNNCYNANDVYDWVTDTTILKSKFIGSMVPFDLITFNITTDILTTLLLATPKLVTANFHSLNYQSRSRVDWLFKNLQLALSRLHEAHGTNFTQSVNITLFLIEYEEEALNKTFADILWNVVQSAVHWKTVLSDVINEVAVVASSFTGLESLRDILKNRTAQKWVSCYC